ncbi:MAG: insulinase family protein [Bacteroidetes bacterium]|nr:MAG: insulinase family protein [Bacteroidota bacterium]
MVSHCGLMVETGSRDESEEENGLAHMIEHLIFKGTRKRKTWHILSRIENVGGELNAYTTKEETVIYASFLSPYYERTLELFADVTFHSVFPEKEVEKEKEVIIDEINSYNDAPAELIYDDFEALIFDGHPLGRNILGSAEKVKSFFREDIVQFLKSRYSTRNMVIASVGDIDFDKLVKLVEKYFENVSASENQTTRTPFQHYHPSKKRLKKESYLAHLMLGGLAYSRLDKKKPAMMLLNNLLGGSAMNSRLNMGIREKYGFAYEIESYYQPYSDTGVFSVYLGTDQKQINRGIELIKKELNLLKKKRTGILQFDRAQKQFLGQMAISYEVPVNEMLGMARSHLYRPSVNSFEQNISIIKNITSDDLQEVANEIFNVNQLSQLIYESK